MCPTKIPVRTCQLFLIFASRLKYCLMRLRTVALTSVIVSFVFFRTTRQHNTSQDGNIYLGLLFFSVRTAPFPYHSTVHHLWSKVQRRKPVALCI